MEGLSEDLYDSSTLTRKTQMKLCPNICLMTILLALAITGSTLRASAEDNPPATNPTGTWKLKPLTNAPFEPTLELKLEGTRLTGTLTRNTGSKIEAMTLENGKLKGSAISFNTHYFSQVKVENVPQPPSTNNMTRCAYQGTISGDTIHGKVEIERVIWGSVDPARHRTQDWEARRVKNTTQ
jgi:hypothetical protein